MKRGPSRILASALIGLAIPSLVFAGNPAPEDCLGLFASASSRLSRPIRESPRSAYLRDLGLVGAGELHVLEGIFLHGALAQAIQLKLAHVYTHFGLLHKDKAEAILGTDSKSIDQNSQHVLVFKRGSKTLEAFQNGEPLSATEIAESLLAYARVTRQTRDTAERPQSEPLPLSKDAAARELDSHGDLKGIWKDTDVLYEVNRAAIDPSVPERDRDAYYRAFFVDVIRDDLGFRYGSDAQNLRVKVVGSVHSRVDTPRPKYPHIEHWTAWGFNHVRDYELKYDDRPAKLIVAKLEDLLAESDRRAHEFIEGYLSGRDQAERDRDARIAHTWNGKERLGPERMIWNSKWHGGGFSVFPTGGGKFRAEYLAGDVTRSFEVKASYRIIPSPGVGNVLAIRFSGPGINAVAHALIADGKLSFVRKRTVKPWGFTSGKNIDDVLGARFFPNEPGASSYSKIGDRTNFEERTQFAIHDRLLLPRYYHWRTFEKEALKAKHPDVIEIAGLGRFDPGETLVHDFLRLSEIEVSTTAYVPENENLYRRRSGTEVPSDPTYPAQLVSTLLDSQGDWRTTLSRLGIVPE